MLVEKKDSSSANGAQSRIFAIDAKARLLNSLLQFDVGLLRMTVFNTRSTISRDGMGLHRKNQKGMGYPCKQLRLSLIDLSNFMFKLAYLNSKYAIMVPTNNLLMEE
jgi:hypothetical protein